MLGPDEIEELKAQARYDRRRQRADAIDSRDPDYDGPDPEPETN